MNIEQVIAREQIRNTMSIYNNCGDRGKMAEMVMAFKEDGVLELDNGTFTGRKAIADHLGGGITDRRSRPENATKPLSLVLRHNLTTSRIIFISETEANAWTYFFVLTAIGPDHAGTYIDTFQKTGDDWLIANRRVKIDWRGENAIFGA